MRLDLDSLVEQIKKNGAQNELEQRILEANRDLENNQSLANVWRLGMVLEEWKNQFMTPGHWTELSKYKGTIPDGHYWGCNGLLPRRAGG